MQEIINGYQFDSNVGRFDSTVQMIPSEYIPSNFLLLIYLR